MAYTSIDISVRVNEAWLKRDLLSVLATAPKMTVEQALKSLPLGKYLHVDGLPAREEQPQTAATPAGDAKSSSI